MSDILLIVAVLWFLVGVWIVWRTGQRDFLTDAMLIVFWPFHYLYEVLRK